MKDLVVVRNQLISCCEEELSEDLENLYCSKLDNKTEEQLLAMMRQLAVVADKEIRKQVLGKLEVMSLDGTVKFIEAKESDRQGT